MVYENIDISHPNFCIGAGAGTFCTVDTSGSAAILRVKSSTGTSVANYDFYPTDILHVDSDSGKNPYRKVVGIEYIGPNGVPGFYTNLRFYTLERSINPSNTAYSSLCIIRSWVLNLVGGANRLEYEPLNTISKSGSFNCNTFAIEKTVTEFAEDAVDGIEIIELTTTSGLEKYDRLIFGPSTDLDNIGAVEQCYVQSVISPTEVEIRSLDSFQPAPLYQYITGNPVTIRKKLYLISNIGTSGSPSQGGRVYKIDLDDGGTVLDQHDAEVYTDVIASRWSSAYGTLAFVNNTNLLILDVSDYELIRSFFLNNIKDDQKTVFPVYEIEFINEAIYRLQKETVKRNDDDSKTASTSWGSKYNYHEDTLIRYANSISLLIGAPLPSRGLVSSSRIVIQSKEVSITATVRDQFNSTILGKTVEFFKDGDQEAFFTVVGEDLTTDANGEVTVTYTAGSAYEGAVNITAKTDGGNDITGSDYVWTGAVIIRESVNITSTHDGFIIDPPSVSRTLQTETIPLLEPASLPLINYTKFSFPGGHWTSVNPPQGNGGIIKQKEKISISIYPKQLASLYPDYDVKISTLEKTNNGLQVDQMYSSRHYLHNHEDTTLVQQFIFLQSARPVPYSGKNPLESDIWLRLYPVATSLNLSTFKIEIKEHSYAGEEAWRDITSEGTVTVNDGGGGGISGLDFQWYPSESFHHNGQVFVRIEVYDSVPFVPNKIVLEYWFRIVPDFKNPYITDIFPAPESVDVSNDTHISFYVHDAGAGVDIDTLEMYVDYKQVYPQVTEITNRLYDVVYAPVKAFNYGDEVSLQVIVKDSSGSANRLVEVWRFYIKESAAPWYDKFNYLPGLCRRGMPRNYNVVSLQVYGAGDGVDINSLEFFIGNIQRNVEITPVVYRDS